MPDDTRIRHLLEEILDSKLTPEEVCAEEPDLLPEVLARWRRLRRVEHQIDVLFPYEVATKREYGAALDPRIELPRIDGYNVESILGRGGMGVIFKARHLKLNRLVAVKMLLSGVYAHPQELARFRREAEAVAALRHPNIVQIYDVGELDGRSYFTMEFVEGGTLAQKLAGKPQPARQAAELAATLAVAMQFAHKSGIIHRDLKPANILLTAEGILKITDFGLARFVHAGPEFSLAGAPLGTPSYMAPEQAMGQTNAIGPAVDVYALGVVLYESLTGRPPFVGESSAETERKVIAEEPVSPSRLNAKVPRDLETICLKCLRKNPARRYASAQDLADDLYRFLDGKPVLARPVGFVERAVKWARRRPALATLTLALLVLLGAAVWTSVRLQRLEVSRQTETAQRRARASQAVEIAINMAYDSGRAERWREAMRLLDGTANQLADADSDELRSRLDQARTDLRFAQRLESIRILSTLTASEQFFVLVPSYPALVEEFGKVFAEAKFNIDGEARETAARIQASPLSKQTVAAVDQWAFAAFQMKNEPLWKQLLRIAQLADPEPAWRNRFRDPAGWRDKPFLLKLTQDISTTARPPDAHQLAIMGALLRNSGELFDGTPLLREALRERSGDFWLNWELANALGRNKQYAESATYFRIVNALRPGDTWYASRLGSALSLAGEFDEGVRQIRQALKWAPTAGMLRHNLAIALIRAGRSGEALAECRRAMRAAPEDSWPPNSLGYVLASESRHEEAIPMFQRAIVLNPTEVGGRCNLGLSLAAVGRHDEAIAVFRKAVELRPTSVLARLGLGQSLQKRGRHHEAIAEFQWIVRELDPNKPRTGADPRDDKDFRYVSARLGLVTSLLYMGRFTEATTAVELALKLPTVDESRRGTLRRQLELCRRLAPLEADPPTLTAGKDPPAEVLTQRALAEWWYTHRRLTAASARLYAAVFKRQPSLADDPVSQDRFRAACAAALASSGQENDAARLASSGQENDAVRLDDHEKAALRRQAFDWLKADRDAWEKRHGAGNVKDQSTAARAVRAWEQDPDLACVRDQTALARLPDAERKKWLDLWTGVRALASRDPFMTLEEARGQVARKQWARAAEIYTQLVKQTPPDDGEIWFEYAAVQLLSGNQRGYRQTCKRMLESDQTTQQLRHYLIARACTLAPDSADDPALPSRIGTQELRKYESAYWSLTEQGALCCRANRHREAERLFKQSLLAETRAGAAVLNWLWLALAHQQLGENAEARRWLDKAAGWLDALGDEMPACTGILHLHRHNWLEAHALRQEAERLLGSSRGRK